jgi:GT2 family glycosyltransferase
MQQLQPVVVNDRFNIADTDVYIMFGLWPKDSSGYAILNGKKLEIKKEEWQGYSVIERFELGKNPDLESVSISVKLPDPLPNSGEVQVYAEKGGKKINWFSRSVDYLKKRGRNPQAFVEQIKRYSSSEAVISGWVASDKTAEIETYAADGSKIVPQKITFSRPDVVNAFPECEVVQNCGFQLAFKDVNTSEIRVVFKNERGQDSFKFPMGTAAIVSDFFNNGIVKGFRYLRKNGPSKFASRVISKLQKTDRPVEYKEWVKHNFPGKEELEKQKQEKFEKEPLISIVVPLYKTNTKFLNAIVDSVKSQTYSNWELCLSDGSGTPSPIADELKALEKNDERIHIIPADKQRRIVLNTNVAIKEARGEYIAFADHDDILAPDALYEVVKAINEYNEPDMIYTDEDKVDETGKKYFEPSMKPDFNIDLLRTVNYICHLCVIRKDMLDKTGYLDDNFEGSQDYDIVLRVAEKTDKICHIPKVLYHWRRHAESTSINPESKKYAFDAGRRAVQAHYDRVGIKAEVIDGEWDGLYRTRYIRAYDPLVSIIIPNKDHTDDLDRCIKSICEHSTYENYEFVIVENNSEDQETFEYYKKLEAENPKARVVYYKDKFNYSKINNFGETQAKGEYLLLLNNDTSMINKDCIEELLGYCMRDDVGIVGARLYYEDDTIQHAGVVIGFGGIAGHCFVNQNRGVTGYCHRIICAQDYSAVTAACMMVDRKVYNEVGGFTEALAVAFNDVDFCLKVRKAGYLVVYNPYAELYHYESKSRGYEDTPEKVARFNQEINEIEKRWPDILEKGDPYYNRNLTLKSQDFSLDKNW